MGARAKAGTGAGAPGGEGARGAILDFIKHRRDASVAELAAHLGISYEGARQQLRQLVDAGLLEPRAAVRAGTAAGRPRARYALTGAGDHLFPKAYDELTVGLIDALIGTLGEPALKQVLAAFTERRVREWAPRLAGKPLLQRVTALAAIYGDDDPYMSVETGRDGIRLIERNCPFLNVASRRPALCSVTVSALQRLLGVRVVREERFQAGHGRCVFRVHPDRPIDPRRNRFTLESEQREAPA